MKKKQSFLIAFSGLVAALSVVLLFCTGLVPVATLALPALAGCFLISVVIEAGPPWGFGVYGVCGVLSLLLCPDREAALVYLLFFGYYPVLFAYLGRIKNPVLRVGAKFGLFNCAVAAEVLITVYLLGIPLETMTIFDPYTPVVLLLLANVAFFLYDRALDGLILLYLRRIHPKVERMVKR